MWGGLWCFIRGRSVEEFYGVCDFFKFLEADLNFCEMCYSCSHEVNMKKRLMLALVTLVGVVNSTYADELKQAITGSDSKKLADMASASLSDRLKSNGLVQTGVGQDPTNCTGLSGD